MKGQHIGGIFTFLAGLIILAHSVVPHHHHFELTHSSEQESACESSGQEKSNEDQNSHCHAFNILLSEKSPNSFNQPISEFSNFYLAGTFINIEIPTLTNNTTTTFGYQAIFFKQFFTTAQSLRAPPAYA